MPAFLRPFSPKGVSPLPSLWFSSTCDSGGLQVDKHLLGLAVTSLPGVGWSTRQKLAGMGIETVADLRLSSLDALQKELGAKTGLLLW